MTLSEFFNFLDANPLMVLAFLLAVPFTALVAGFISKGEGHLSPWKYLYSFLVYAICIPGILATALAAYVFLFERGGSIFNANLMTQVLPIVSMILTLAIIKRNTPFQYIPGFGKLSSLITLIGSALIIMYVMQKVNLFVWIHLPAHYFLLMMVGLILVMRYTLKSMIS